MKYFIFLFFYLSILFSAIEYDNIFEIKSSPRNIAIGNIHASTNDISSIFDSPIYNSEVKRNFFVSINKYSNLINVYHLGYSIISNNKLNLSFGLVRREIHNNFNTTNADIDGGYPNLYDIDYSNISKFKDNQTGILLSYNKKMSENLILGINFKPEFHKILNVSAVGFRMDVRYLFLYNKYNFIIGVDDLFAVKKWDTGLIEKSNLNTYLSISAELSKSIVFLFEYNLDKNIKIGTEFKVIDEILFRLGLDDSNLSFGFGFKLKNLDIDYTYIDNEFNVFGDNHVIGFIINLKDFH